MLQKSSDCHVYSDLQKGFIWSYNFYCSIHRFIMNTNNHIITINKHYDTISWLIMILPILLSLLFFIPRPKHTWNHCMHQHAPTEKKTKPHNSALGMTSKCNAYPPQRAMDCMETAKSIPTCYKSRDILKGKAEWRQQMNTTGLKETFKKADDSYRLKKSKTSGRPQASYWGKPGPRTGWKPQ